MRGAGGAGRPRSQPLAALASLVVAGVLLAGCAGSVDSLSFPTPSSTPATTTAEQPTLPADLSAVGQGAVAGVTTTSAALLGPGGASIVGTVLGPGGPVQGATVQVQRIVGTSVATIDVSTAADGSWKLNGILGGVYRIRAWQTPDLLLADPDIIFLGATQSQTVTLQVNQYQGPDVAASASDGSPQVGTPVSLLVQVTNPEVQKSGVLYNPAVADVAVTLTDGPNWQVDNGNPLTTNAAGDVTFVVTCTSPGANSLSAQVGNGNPIALQMPSCAAAPTTTVPPYNPCPTTTTIFGDTTPGGAGEPTTTTTLVFGGC